MAPNDKGFKLFGFEIKRVEAENPDKKPSIVPARDDDGAGYVTAAGTHYGQYLNIDGDDAKDNYNLDSAAIQPNDLLKILDGKYYAQVHRLEGFPKKHWTYTILTSNKNFYANGVLVHSEIGD